MKYRDSSNITTHYDSDVLAGARAANANAARIYGGSSGNPVGLEAVGDSTAVDVTITAKAAGVIRLASTAGIYVGSTVATSTGYTPQAAIGFFKSVSLYEYGNASSGQTEEIKFASTTVNALPGDLVSVDMGLLSTTVGYLGHRLSTAAASRVTVVLGVIGSSAVGSTQSGSATISWIKFAQ